MDSIPVPPVETEIGVVPSPAVKLVADPVATITGSLTETVVVGMVNVTLWLAGVAPVAVTVPTKDPEIEAPARAVA
jgi:hypothetical protein